MATYQGIEKFIFADVYNLFLKYKDIPDEVYYWDKLREDCNLLMFKYGENQFVSDMLAITITQINRRVSNRELYNAETDKIGKLMNKEFGR